MTILVWFGILGPSDEDAERIIVLTSWTRESQNLKLENGDSKALSNLNSVPFLEDDETKVVISGIYKIIEYKPKSSHVSFASIGFDELEMDEFLQAFSKACLSMLSIDSITKLSCSIIRSNRQKINLLSSEMVVNGRVERMDGDAAVRQLKMM